MKSKCLLISSPIVAAALMLAANATATPIDYVTNLSDTEIPRTGSPGTGSVLATFDFDAHTLDLHVTFSDLTSGTTVAHIHAPTLAPASGKAGVATQVPSFINFPIGVTSGTYDPPTFNTLDSSFYNPAFLTANGGTPELAEAALAQALAEHKAYFNIHTENFPSGEIRGFLRPLSVPDAGPTMLCLVMGLIGLEMFRRKFRARLNR